MRERDEGIYMLAVMLGSVFFGFAVLAARRAVPKLAGARVIADEFAEGDADVRRRIRSMA